MEYFSLRQKPNLLNNNGIISLCLRCSEVLPHCKDCKILFKKDPFC